MDVIARLAGIWPLKQVSACNIYCHGQ